MGDLDCRLHHLHRGNPTIICYIIILNIINTTTVVHSLVLKHQLTLVCLVLLSLRQQLALAAL